MQADPTGGTTAAAIRGHVVTLTGDPFLEGSENVLVDEPDGLVLIEDGLITGVGPYPALRDRVPDGVEVAHHPGSLITAGFVDTHVHYVQTEIVAAFGAQLIDWLNTYTFVEEQRFADPAHAAAVATSFFDQLVLNGTTTALTFCATYPASVEAFFAEATRRNMRMIGGKVLMDRNAPDGLLDTAEQGARDSEELLRRWDGTGRNHYAITPRFAPTSTPEQLAAAGELWKSHPDAFVHTHVSENRGEISWVRSLFPERDGYLDVYDHYGLLGRRAVLAHGVHLTGQERRRCHDTGTAIAHCPTSNLFLGSGLFHVRQAKDPHHPVHVGLGTDIGAGTSFSLLNTMGEAYKVAELNSYPLDAVKAFHLATLGGAEALDLAGHIGSVAVGKEADLVVLDPRATALMAERSARAGSVQELMFVLAVLGDDRAVEATYVAGELAHSRDRTREIERTQP
ncbi:guanine deaminase [Pseudonocardia nematodicida]|uniref:Guanine deaminase n=1 Tax=Pseudonocardia nematodicida TaxID=1206997 RepID=A0ABV1K6T2_9PSEU